MIKYDLLKQFEEFHNETGKSLWEFPQREQIISAFGDSKTVYRFAGLTAGCYEWDIDADKIETYRAQFQNSEYRARQFVDALLSAKEKYEMPSYTRAFFKPYTTKKAWEKAFATEEEFLDALLTFCYSKSDINAILTRYIMFVNKHGRIPEPEEIENSDLLIARYHDWEGLAERFKADALYTTKKLEDNKKLKKAYFAFMIRQTAEKLGRTPRFAEVEYSFGIMNLFGSWRNAIIFSGLDPWNSKAKRESMQHISNEMLRDEFIELIKGLGYIPSNIKFKHSPTAAKRFGGWNNFVSAILEFAPELKAYPRCARSRAPRMAEITKVVREYNLLEMFKDGDARVAMANAEKEAHENAKEATTNNASTGMDSNETLEDMNLLLKDFTNKSIAEEHILTENEFAPHKQVCGFFGSWQGFVLSAIITNPILNNFPNPNEME